MIVRTQSGPQLDNSTAEPTKLQGMAEPSSVKIKNGGKRYTSTKIQPERISRTDGARGRKRRHLRWDYTMYPSFTKERPC